MTAASDAELAKLREALRFYADRRNHSGVGVSPVYNDNGHLAREALGVCEPCRGTGQTKTGRRLMDMDGTFEEYKTCSLCRGGGVRP